MNRPYEGRKPEPPYDCPSCADRDAQLDRLGDELAEAHLEIARLSSLLVAESELRLVAEASLHNLERAARKVVEVLVDAKHTLEWTKGKEPEWERGSIALIDAALADPVIVKLRRG
jgi:hypothetical protein